MSLFRRKKPDLAPIPIKTPCEVWGHLWQDMPWTLSDEYEGSSSYNTSHIEIVETYVCHICGKEKKVKLFSEYEKLSRKAHDEKVKKLEEKYADHLKPVPIVNDMINDMKLLDRERLAAWERLHSNNNSPSEFRFKLGTEVFDIK